MTAIADFDMASSPGAVSKPSSTTPKQRVAAALAEAMPQRRDGRPFVEPNLLAEDALTFDPTLAADLALAEKVLEAIELVRTSRSTPYVPQLTITCWEDGYSVSGPGLPSRMEPWHHRPTLTAAITAALEAET
jgi:hypothetical protein